VALTQAPRPRASLNTGRRRLAAGIVIVAALVVLAWRGLGNATVYFKPADEAVAQRAQLGGHRFRIEGVVQDGTVHQVGQTVAFVIANNGVSVPVVHQGDPPELFKAGLPVVLEGRFLGDHFASDRIMVKHTETYIAKHPDRVAGYPGAPPGPGTPAGSAATPGSGTP
jgi:cytochrome c-type biogenesis protein CcmE